MASFLGFANFYWHFIKNFSHKAKPFNELKGIKEGLGYDEVGTMDEELTSSAVSSYIDSSGAIDIYAKTCRK